MCYVTPGATVQEEGVVEDEARPIWKDCEKRGNEESELHTNPDQRKSIHIFIISSKMPD